MSQVRAVCPGCGKVLLRVLDPGDVSEPARWLIVGPQYVTPHPDAPEDRERASWHFPCPNRPRCKAHPVVRFDTLRALLSSRERRVVLP
jgi:hypothetical protein